MTTNQWYVAIGVTIFLGNVMYAQYEDSRITTIENNVEVIHEEIHDIKQVILEQTTTPVKYTQKEFDCLARNIYYEAGVENFVGKVAVAQVTINRVKTGAWGKNICKVVYAKDQFSWTKDKKRAWLQNRGPAWEESKLAASQVLHYGIRVKPLKKALFYHADYVKPHWSDNTKRITKLGQHIFYTQAKDTNIKL